MTNEQISLLNDAVVFGLPLLIGGRFAWNQRSRLTGWLGSLGSLLPNRKPAEHELTIADAYEALQSVEDWGEGRPAEYAQGVTLIKDNWLRTAAEEPAE